MNPFLFKDLHEPTWVAARAYLGLRRSIPLFHVFNSRSFIQAFQSKVHIDILIALIFEWLWLLCENDVCSFVIF